MAPGTEHTLAELCNPDRRPQQPYHEPDPAITNFEPDDPLHIQRHLLISLLRRTRRGAVPGPSGLTGEALRFVLDDEEATTRFVQVAECLARGQVPVAVSELLGLGRMVALPKANGGVRGLVIGDLLRRVVARALAQMFSHQFQSACSPWQFALSTRAGSEAVVRAFLVPACSTA